MIDPTQVENWSMGSKKEDKIKEILQITKKLTDSQIEQIIRHANEDIDVINNTHDGIRFSTVEAFRKWQQGKELYGMTGESNKLLGFIWFEKMKLPDNETFSAPVNPTDYGITFAIRLYDKARGQGLTRKFMDAAFSDLLRQPFYMNEEHKGIWLSTSHDNVPATKGYQHFGFKQISEPNKMGKIFMLYNPLKS